MTDNSVAYDVKELKITYLRTMKQTINPHFDIRFNNF